MKTRLRASLRNTYHAKCLAPHTLPSWSGCATLCAATPQTGHKPAAHAAMLSDIAHEQQTLHHDRLYGAHKSREARRRPCPTACLYCVYRLSGAEVYSERSKDCWLDLMKAASLQGDAGIPYLMVVSSNLAKSVVSVAGLLVGKSWDKYKQADTMLKEVQQVSVSCLGRMCVYVYVLTLCHDFVSNGACSIYPLQACMPVLTFKDSFETCFRNFSLVYMQ